MKKHFIAILILTLILIASGVGIYFAVRLNNTKPLYKASSEFILSEDTSTLSLNIEKSEKLYNLKEQKSETRLTTLKTIIDKIDTFENDLSTQLILAKSKAASTNKLSKTYKSLSASRKVLIKNYNEYIDRMNGNTHIGGDWATSLYDDIFTKTVEYIYEYNACFNSTSKYVFSKVYKVDNIKHEVYLLYSASVTDLLNNISNIQFKSTTLINRLNNGIYLDNANIKILDSINGGEYSLEALNFQKYFNQCNLTSLIENFDNYYTLITTINPSTEQSSEKLTVYYASKIFNLKLGA